MHALSLAFARGATLTPHRGAPGVAAPAAAPATVLTEPLLTLDADGERILYYASLAPSGHNAQPWVVRVEAPERWTIGVDPARRLPAVDPTDHDTLMALGAFTENLVLAAGALGYAADAEVVDGGSDDDEVLRVRLRRERATGFALEQIQKRRTLRNGHLPRPLAVRDVEALLRELDGRGSYHPHGSPQGRHLSQATLEAFRAQSYRDAAQAELAEWLRFRPAEARERRDGLTPESLELPWVGRFAMQHFMGRGAAMGRGFRERGIEAAARQVVAGAGWIVMENEGADRAALVAAGRRFRRLALGLREKRIAAHPMSQLLQERPWREQVGAALGGGAPPQLVLRVGYVATYPLPVTLRRPVRAFVRAG